MKRLTAILILLITVPFSTWGQKIPAALENPSTPELASQYSKVYRDMKGCRVAEYFGLGVTALGTTLLIRSTTAARSTVQQGGEINEGNGMAIVFGSLITGCGGLISVGELAGEMICRQRLSNIRGHNDFLLQPGMTEEIWRYNKAAKHYQSSRTAMKVSAITTGCLVGCTAAGMVACLYSDSDLLYYSTETAMWLSFAGAATFLTSWAVNGVADYNMSRYSPEAGGTVTSLSPFIMPSPAHDGTSVVGLTLAARF